MPSVFISGFLLVRTVIAIPLAPISRYPSCTNPHTNTNTRVHNTHTATPTHAPCHTDCAHPALPFAPSLIHAPRFCRGRELTVRIKLKNSSDHFKTPASGYPGVMDDLIFSGAGSGCRGDDEDECTPPFENGSGDDLITPVYVPPTKQTATTSSGGGKDGASGRARGKAGEKLCDDEDCLHGSGSGEVTEVFTTSTARSSGRY